MGFNSENYRNLHYHYRTLPKPPFYVQLPLHIKDGKKFCRILKHHIKGNSYELKQREEEKMVMNVN